MSMGRDIRLLTSCMDQHKPQGHFHSLDHMSAGLCSAGTLPISPGGADSHCSAGNILKTLIVETPPLSRTQDFGERASKDSEVTHLIDLAKVGKGARLLGRGLFSYFLDFLLLRLKLTGSGSGDGCAVNLF